MRKNRRIAVMLTAVLSLTTVMPAHAGLRESLLDAYSDTIAGDDDGSTGSEQWGVNLDTTGILDSTYDAGTMTAASSQSTKMVSCTDAQTGLDVARAAVPDGYSVTNQTSWCSETASPDYPVSVFVDAISPDGSIELTYESTLQFVHVLDSNSGGMTYSSHVNGQVDPSLHMMMLEYMNAAQYLDFMASIYSSNLATQFTTVGDVPATAQQQAQLDQIIQEEKDNANYFLQEAYSQTYGQGMYVDQAEASMSERSYQYTDANGKAKILKMFCIVKGLRLVSTISGAGVEMTKTNWMWTVPFRYSMIVDADKEDEADPIFRVFCDNTTVSDQFKQECEKLSQQIMEIVLQTNQANLTSLSGDVQNAFTSDIGQSDDTYSAIEGWDDVIMERNDYTLSNGDSVKVDTAYDYVYQLDDNSVYATNSASDEPAGGVLLSPN